MPEVPPSAKSSVSCNLRRYVLFVLGFGLTLDRIGLGLRIYAITGAISSIFTKNSVFRDFILQVLVFHSLFLQNKFVGSLYIVKNSYILAYLRQVYVTHTALYLGCRPQPDFSMWGRTPRSFVKPPLNICTQHNPEIVCTSYTACRNRLCWCTPVFFPWCLSCWKLLQLLRSGNDAWLTITTIHLAGSIVHTRRQYNRPTTTYVCRLANQHLSVSTNELSCFLSATMSAALLSIFPQAHCGQRISCFGNPLMT